MTNEILIKAKYTQTISAGHRLSKPAQNKIKPILNPFLPVRQNPPQKSFPIPSAGAFHRPEASDIHKRVYDPAAQI
jgi:hypothetical protein